MNKEKSDANEKKQRQKFRDRDDRDCAGAFANPADVDQHQRAVNNEHDNDPHDRTAKKRNDERNRIRENVYDSRDGTERSQKIEHAGEKSDIATARDFDIRVKAASQRNATARDGETSDEQHHRDRTANKRQRRSGTETFRHG